MKIEYSGIKCTMEMLKVKMELPLFFMISIVWLKTPQWLVKEFLVKILILLMRSQRKRCCSFMT
ncbi:hypothetical protein CK498_19510 [Halomonas salipaludis]|uniref:Uncharacterized protein n=1 Tax=Halomonas salipaludis TaxID=2032625 RepID=A0A2A2EQE4_9GAMM|nr:hypothetical protein CK498_19510 [Halomonas salipaludis]